MKISITKIGVRPIGRPRAAGVSKDRISGQETGMAERVVKTIQRVVLVALGTFILLGLVAISVPNRFVESLGLGHTATAGPPPGTGQEQVLLNRSE